MGMPWVSRERYDEAQREIGELKRERERLLDRVAVLSGQAPLFAAPESVVAAVAQESQAATANGKAAQPRRMTRMDLIQRAQAAAAKGELKRVAVKAGV